MAKNKATLIHMQTCNPSSKGLHKCQDPQGSEISSNVQQQQLRAPRVSRWLIMEMCYKQRILKTSESLSGKGGKILIIQGLVERMAVFWQTKKCRWKCPALPTFVFTESRAQVGPVREKALWLLATMVFFLSWQFTSPTGMPPTQMRLRAVKSPSGKQCDKLNWKTRQCFWTMR